MSSGLLILLGYVVSNCLHSSVHLLPVSL